MKGPPKEPWENGKAVAYLGIAFLIAFAMFLLCMSTDTYAAEPITVKIRDMGRGMELLKNPYAQDPEAVILSKNMYSLMPGMVQMRPGTIELIEYDSDVSDPIDALCNFAPVGDSAAFIVMSGGHWYWSFYGKRANGRMQYVDSMAALRMIHPFTSGTLTHTSGDDDASFVGTKHIRHLQAGDTIFTTSEVPEAETLSVDHVVSDILLNVTEQSGNFTAATNVFTANRAYTGSQPYLYASGDYVFTGSHDDFPQTIYNQNDTLYIRPLVMVDSFYVDAIYSLYSDTTDDGTLLRRSWDVASSDTAIHEIQLVSRRADWENNEWLETPEEAPVTYYVRIGWWQSDDQNQTRYYVIRGNTDTSMYLSAWYIDNDSALGDRGLELADTMVAADMVNSQWAYIYCAVGSYDVALDDADSPEIEAFGRGAVWVTTDTSSVFDTTVLSDGMHYLHLTTDDIEFPAYTSGGPVRTYTLRLPRGTPFPNLPEGDTVISMEAERDYWILKIRSGRSTKVVDAKYVGRSYFPIRYATVDNDTLILVTGAAEVNMLVDNSTATTSDWEIVRIGIPKWEGVSGWGNPEQLVAWGDTAAPALISRSGMNDPWNWTATLDVIVGDPADPIRGVYGYDNQLMLYKEASIVGFDGTQFTEISLSDGLVGPRAMVGLNKFLYWLDKDGLKRMQRRDFSGYSITSLGGAFNPVFSSWSSTDFSDGVVPFAIEASQRHLSVLTHNQYDQHLYLFIPDSGETENTHCVVYDLKRDQFGGYFDLRASDAFWMMYDDTARIICGSPDSGLVYAITPGAYADLANDAGATGISMQRKGHRFYLTDKDGMPIEAQLIGARIMHRGVQIGLDATSYFYIRADDGLVVDHGEYGDVADSVLLDLHTVLRDYVQHWYPSSGIKGVYWQYDFVVGSVAAAATGYQIFGLDLVFVPVGRDD